MSSKSDTSDAHATLCSLAVWADKPTPLQHVAGQLTLPTLAQVVTGRYRGIAPADSRHHHHSSSRRSSSVVFIHSFRTSQKVIIRLSLSVIIVFPTRLLRVNKRKDVCMWLRVLITYSGYVGRRGYRTFEAVCLTACPQHNSKTNDPSV